MAAAAGEAELEPGPGAPGRPQQRAGEGGAPGEPLPGARQSATGAPEEGEGPLPPPPRALEPGEHLPAPSRLPETLPASLGGPEPGDPLPAPPGDPALLPAPLGDHESGEPLPAPPKEPLPAPPRAPETLPGSLGGPEPGDPLPAPPGDPEPLPAPPGDPEPLPAPPVAPEPGEPLPAPPVAPEPGEPRPAPPGDPEPRPAPLEDPEPLPAPPVAPELGESLPAPLADSEPLLAPMEDSEPLPAPLVAPEQPLPAPPKDTEPLPEPPRAPETIPASLGGPELGDHESLPAPLPAHVGGPEPGNPLPAHLGVPEPGDPLTAQLGVPKHGDPLPVHVGSPEHGDPLPVHVGGPELGDPQPVHVGGPELGDALAAHVGGPELGDALAAHMGSPETGEPLHAQPGEPEAWEPLPAPLREPDLLPTSPGGAEPGELLPAPQRDCEPLPALTGGPEVWDLLPAQLGDSEPREPLPAPPRVPESLFTLREAPEPMETLPAVLEGPKTLAVFPGWPEPGVLLPAPLKDPEPLSALTGDPEPMEVLPADPEVLLPADLGGPDPGGPLPPHLGDPEELLPAPTGNPEPLPAPLGDPEPGGPLAPPLEDPTHLIVPLTANQPGETLTAHLGASAPLLPDSLGNSGGGFLHQPLGAHEPIPAPPGSTESEEPHPAPLGDLAQEGPLPDPHSLERPMPFPPKAQWQGEGPLPSPTGSPGLLDPSIGGTKQWQGPLSDPPKSPSQEQYLSATPESLAPDGPLLSPPKAPALETPLTALGQQDGFLSNPPKSPVHKGHLPAPLESSALAAPLPAPFGTPAPDVAHHTPLEVQARKSPLSAPTDDLDCEEFLHSPAKTLSTTPVDREPQPTIPAHPLHEERPLGDVAQNVERPLPRVPSSAVDGPLHETPKVQLQEEGPLPAPSQEWAGPLPPTSRMPSHECTLHAANAPLPYEGVILASREAPAQDRTLTAHSASPAQKGCAAPQWPLGYAVPDKLWSLTEAPISQDGSLATCPPPSDGTTDNVPSPLREAVTGVCSPLERPPAPSPFNGVFLPLDSPVASLLDSPRVLSSLDDLSSEGFSTQDGPVAESISSLDDPMPKAISSLNFSLLVDGPVAAYLDNPVAEAFSPMDSPLPEALSPLDGPEADTLSSLDGPTAFSPLNGPLPKIHPRVKSLTKALTSPLYVPLAEVSSPTVSSVDKAPCISADIHAQSPFPIDVQVKEPSIIDSMVVSSPLSPSRAPLPLHSPSTGAPSLLEIPISKASFPLEAPMTKALLPPWNPLNSPGADLAEVSCGDDVVVALSGAELAGACSQMAHLGAGVPEAPSGVAPSGAALSAEAPSDGALEGVLRPKNSQLLHNNEFQIESPVSWTEPIVESPMPADWPLLPQDGPLICAKIASPLDRRQLSQDRLLLKASLLHDQPLPQNGLVTEATSKQDEFLSRTILNQAEALISKDGSLAPLPEEEPLAGLNTGSEVLVTLDHIIEDALVVSFRLGEKIFSGVLMDLSKRFGPHGIPVTIFPKREYKHTTDSVQPQVKSFQEENLCEEKGTSQMLPPLVQPSEPSRIKSVWTSNPPPLFHEGAPYPPPLFIRDTYNQSIPQPPPRKIRRPKRKMYREEPTSIMNAIKLRPRQVLCDKCKNSIATDKKEIKRGGNASEDSRKRRHENITTVSKRLKTHHPVNEKSRNESQKQNAVASVSNIAHGRGRIVRVPPPANTSKAQLHTKKVLQSKNMEHAKAREVLKLAKEKAQKHLETPSSKNAHPRVQVTRRFQSPSSVTLPPRLRLKPQRYRNEENDSSLKTGLETVRSSKMMVKPPPRYTATRSAGEALSETQSPTKGPDEASREIQDIEVCATPGEHEDPQPLDKSGSKSNITVYMTLNQKQPDSSSASVCSSEGTDDLKSSHSECSSTENFDFPPGTMHPPSSSCSSSSSKEEKKKSNSLKLKVFSKNVSKCIGTDGRTICAGDIVWAKIYGFPWWPARILNLTVSRKDNGLLVRQEARISWFGSPTTSFVAVSQLAPFLDHFQLRFNKKRKGLYRKAITEAAKAAKSLTPEVRALLTQFET